MQSSDKKPLLLAPAGSIESLKAAVHSGADAVYFGLDKFNARMKAGNFTPDNLDEWVKFCHLFNVKVFITLNTSIKNDEILAATQLAIDCYNKNVDGLIVTDLGLLKSIKEILPNMDVTISTQQNIHNVLGAKMAQILNADRIVVSREAHLCDITKIKQNTNIEIETFLHGAMCVSVSGQCYFSSFIDSNSGNRGLCAQPCRQKYDAHFGGKKLNSGYLLSSKDLCLINHINNLKKAGVSVLKIEGRNRRPQYVAQTVSTYRKILDGKQPDENDIFCLKSAFNRGDYTCDGYFFNNSDKIYPLIQGHMGAYVGNIINKKGVLYLKSGKHINKGDAFKVLCNGLEAGGAVALSDSENNLTKLSVSQGVKENDKVYITSLTQQNEFSLNKKIEISAYFSAKINQKPKLTLTRENISITVFGDILTQKPINRHTTKEEITQQLLRIGNTHYTIADIVVDCDEVFLPLSSINSLRRNAIEAIEQEIITQYNKKLNRKFFKNVTFAKMPVINAADSILLYLSSFDKSINFDSNTIFVYKPDQYSIQGAREFCETTKLPKYLDLPNFATEKDIEVLTSILKEAAFEGVVANNLYGILLAKELNKKIICGLGLNIFNDRALDSLRQICGNLFESFVYSKELTLNEINDFSDKSGYIFAEGEICVMTLAHCPVQVSYNCNCGTCKYKGDLSYTDKTNRKFALKRKKVYNCYWEIYNCYPLSGVKKLFKAGRYLLKTNDNNLQQVYAHYSAINASQNSNYQPNEYTTGHLSKKTK